ncbi:MAG: beta-class carbonic anhydrase [Anaerotignum sp.]
MNAEVEKLLRYNQVFVDNEIYLKFSTSKYPDRKMAILSCMDTRMTELLPAALGLKNGDVKVIKNAGAMISHPYGSIIFSLLVAIYDLGVDTILVIGHDDCGVRGMSGEAIVKKMKEKGITQEALDEVERSHKNAVEWLSGFEDVCESVHKTVEIVRNHPLIHSDIEVYGFVMDPETGGLREVK